jgi:hypothetical protein
VRDGGEALRRGCCLVVSARCGQGDLVVVGVSAFTAVGGVCTASRAALLSLHSKQPEACSEEQIKILITVYDVGGKFSSELGYKSVVVRDDDDFFAIQACEWG